MMVTNNGRWSSIVMALFAGLLGGWLSDYTVGGQPVIAQTGSHSSKEGRELYVKHECSLTESFANWIECTIEAEKSYEAELVHQGNIEWVRAEGFQLIDKKGGIRGKFYTDHHGNAVLELQDRTGQVEAYLNSTQVGVGERLNGHTGVSVVSKPGTDSIFIGDTSRGLQLTSNSGPGSGPGIFMRAAESSAHMAIHDNWAEFEVESGNSDGKTKGVLFADGSQSVLALRDREGVSGAHVRVGVDGSSSLVLNNVTNTEDNGLFVVGKDRKMIWSATAGGATSSNNLWILWRHWLSADSNSVTTHAMGTWASKETCEAMIVRSRQGGQPSGTILVCLPERVSPTGR